MRRRAFGLAAASSMALAGVPLAEAVQVTRRSDHTIDQLHQILILDGGQLPSTLSLSAQSSMTSLKAQYPEATHRLWGGEQLRDMIATEFPPDVLRAYDTLTPYAFKADLGRYCLLHRFGGLYSDLSLLHYYPWLIPKWAHVGAFAQLARQDTRHHMMDVANSLVWSRPGAPVLQRSIERFVEHCAERYYGELPIDPTGPGLLGWAFAAEFHQQYLSGRAQNQYLGLCDIEYNEQNTSLHFLAKDSFPASRRSLAIRPPRPGGDSRYLSPEAGINYWDLWHQRKIYADTPPKSSSVTQPKSI